MRRRLMLVLAMLVVLSLAVAAPATAKKPSSNLSGPMDIVFAPTHGFACGSVDPVGGTGVFWYGTVRLDGVTYGMTFEADGPSKFVGNTQHYWEHFAIYADPPSGGPETWTQCPNDQNVVLAGDLKGVGRFSNGKITENGTVTYAAGPFDGWEGRRMHADGLVEEIFPGVPKGFTGIIRFN